MSEAPPHRRLFAELQRRKVFRMAATYGAVGFVVLQVTELIADGLQLPPVVRTTITVLVLVGFPIALALAWALERGPAGEVQRTLDAGDGELEEIAKESRARRWPAGLAALAGTVLLVFGGWYALDRIGGDAGAAGDAEPASSDMPAARRTLAPGSTSGTGLVVMPFAVQGGPDVEYLGDGMVSLLGTKLDGAGDLQTVDARAVLHAMERESLEAGDPDSGARAAVEFGARYHVIGTIVEAGGRMQISASLYDARKSGAPIRTASVEGPEDETFEMVDELAFELLSGLSGGPEARVRRIAGATSDSLPALKAFLEGEEQFRRGQFAASVASFERAVAEDTTFALAHYRLSLVAEWALLDQLSHEAAENAVRWADRLAPRDRRMLDAYLIRRRGDNKAAAEAYRSILGTYPDEMEAWLDLSEVLFHANPLYGRSFTEARATLDRVLEFDPYHSTALIHLARLAAFQDEEARLDTLTERFVGLNPDPGRTLEISTLQAFESGTPDRLAAVRARFPTADDVGLALSVWAASVYAGDLAGGESIVDVLASPARSIEARRLAHEWRAYFALAHGSWTETQRHLADLSRVSPGSALEYAAILSTIPFVPVGNDGLAEVAERLEELDPGSIEPSGNPSVIFSSHDEIHPLIREYGLGLLRARLGQQDAALRHADAAEALVLAPEAGSLATDLAHSIRAHVHYRAGRMEEALRELESARYDAWYGQTMSSPLYARVAERFLRAELLLALGRHAEAEGWYATLGEISPSEHPYRVVALERLAEIAEARGDAARASELRAEFERLWSDADSELLEQVTR